MTQICSHWGKNSWWKSRVGNHDRFRKLRFCRCNTVFPALSRFHSLQLLTQKSKPSAIAFGFEIINDKLVTMANCLSWNFDCCCVTHTQTHVFRYVPTVARSEKTGGTNCTKEILFWKEKDSRNLMPSITQMSRTQC